MNLQDQGYGTEKSKKKKKAPAPPLPVNGETKVGDVVGIKGDMG